MFGTLIGIFLTSAGIVIGADSILWGSNTPAPTRGEKTCQPSARSVAALEGWYGEALYLHRRFHEACRALRQSSELLSAEEQADQLIRKLQRSYQDHTGALPHNAASLPPPSSKHVASLVVAGFDEGTPVATVREIRWDRSRKGQWRLIAERVGKLSFHGCGAKFVGEDGIASLLLDTSPHFEQEKRRPEVRAAVGANRLRMEDSCTRSGFTVEDAKALYKTAIRLTIDHADDYLIQNGAVGGRLHLLTVSPEGSIESEWVDPEQYVAEPPAREGNLSELPIPHQGAGDGSS